MSVTAFCIYFLYVLDREIEILIAIKKMGVKNKHI